MSKRIDRDKREEIRRRARGKSGKETVRSLAREFEVSPGSILKWEHRKDLDDRPRNPKGPPGLSDFGKAVFREMVRLTGYSRRRLFEYLAPVWGELPCQAREKLDDDEQWWGIEPLTRKTEPFAVKICPKILHPKTFRRAMGECGLGEFELAQPERPGTVAIHKVQVRWKYENGPVVDGEIVLLLERNSGALYARAFTDKVGFRAILKCLKRFERMTGEKTSKIFRVTPESGPPIVLGKLTNQVLQDKEIEDDPPSSPQKNPIELPGIYADKYALNRFIKDVVDRINLTDRDYYYRDAKQEMTPYKRFARLPREKEKTAAAERKLKNRMRLTEKCK